MEYREFVRTYLTPHGWRSLGQVGWFRHTETGAEFDAFAVARDEQGVLRPAWKLLAARETGPDTIEAEAAPRSEGMT